MIMKKNCVYETADEEGLTWEPGPGWGRRTRAAPQKPSGSEGGVLPCGAECEGKGMKQKVFTFSIQDLA